MEQSCRNSKVDAVVASNDGMVGFVPTMGAFHAGHLALFATAREENDIVVASLFVNPAQFGPAEDLDRYPRDEERDARLAEEAGVDVLFAPSAEEMYPSGYATWVDVGELGKRLEGEFRPTTSAAWPRSA
jgi:pantoate--beta-alanine ligase